MPRILITGASGAIGRFIVAALQRCGFDVRGQYRREPGNISDVEWRRMDFLETTDFGQLVEGCDAVVHLAAELHDTSRMDRINVAATVALLRAAEAAGVRYFGHGSSVAVYGSPRQSFVDETTPTLDPYAQMRPQYLAEQYMLEYARTKALGERAIHECAPRLQVDLYRPTVVVDSARLLEAGSWSMLRKFGAAYRRTQYIFASDAAAAIAHLVGLGLERASDAPSIRPFNICDENCSNYRDILAAAYKATGDVRFRLSSDLPVIADRAKDLIKYRSFGQRYPLGMLEFSNARLRSTGFVCPTGIRKAVEKEIANIARAS